MSFRRLRILGVRNLADADLDLGVGENWFVGENGAGKTSILEAIYVASRGRGFRAGGLRAIANRELGRFEIFAELSGCDAGKVGVGFYRGSEPLTVRIDGETRSRAALVGATRILYFGSHSHQLVEGGPKVRRQFMDWGAFHVKQGFPGAWSHYARALRQRNAALRSRDLRTAEALEGPLSAAGEILSNGRRELVDALRGPFARVCKALQVTLEVELRYRRGWRSEFGSLSEAFREGRGHDATRETTMVGPHRAELALVCENRPAKEVLSHGQEKLVALALIIAQAEVVSSGPECDVALLLDDLAAELDTLRYEAAIAEVRRLGHQFVCTATSERLVPQPTPGTARVFHVKHGAIAQVL